MRIVHLGLGTLLRAHRAGHPPVAPDANRWPAAVLAAADALIAELPVTMGAGPDMWST
jgi:hypothetical protein